MHKYAILARRRTTIAQKDRMEPVKTIETGNLAEEIKKNSNTFYSAGIK